MVRSQEPPTRSCERPKLTLLTRWTANRVSFRGDRSEGAERGGVVVGRDEADQPPQVERGTISVSSPSSPDGRARLAIPVSAPAGP